jgi:hypothetical protein
MRRTILVAGAASLVALLVVGVAEAVVRRAAETITVSNTDTKPVRTTTDLDPDHRYRLTVTGTVSDWCTTTGCPKADPTKNPQPNVGVDGVWCYAKWRCPTIQAWQQLSVNGKGILDFAGMTPDQVPYSSSHTYSVEFEGISGHLSIGAVDALAGSISDNSGSFEVTLTDLGPSQSSQSYGIALVPSTGQNDQTERLMYQYVGQMPEVKRIYVVTSADQLFQTILRVGKQGRRLKTLVLAGHGSAATPHIELANGDVGPETVDLPAKLAYIKKIDAAGSRASANARATAAAYRSEVAVLDQVSRVLAPGAEVLMINCAAAATPDGQTFVRNLAEVLLGTNGGTLTASRSDVSLGEVLSLLGKLNSFFRADKSTAFGETFIGGDWVKFPVAGGSLPH